ncbi:MAG: hypothetical protein ACYC2P_05555 [Paludibacteraceae bacterium]
MEQTAMPAEKPPNFTQDKPGSSRIQQVRQDMKQFSDKGLMPTTAII